MPNKDSYWQTYFDPATVTRAAAVRTTATVASGGIELHVDIFAHAAADAPVLIFNHGGGGYSRLFTPLALALVDRGYTVALPDQVGQGLSGGTWRDVSIDASIRNAVDVARWARRRFAGPLLMGGGSLGSGIAYNAAAALSVAGSPVDGVLCHNLYDFGRAADALALSRFAWPARLPAVPAAIARLTGAAAGLAPGLPLPYRLLGRFEAMVDRRDTGFYAQWSADPVPLRRVPLRFLASLFNTPAAIPYADNALPILVINPTRDEMVAPAVTRRNFDRLAGPKTYVELSYGHWSVAPSFVTAWIDAVDDWYRHAIAPVDARDRHR